MATVAAYDDGSSTESEYYFDPNEADEESAADAWLHAKDATIKQEVVDLTGDDIISKPLSAVSEELELPKGSEWSHEAVTGDGDAFAVEKALEMATHCGQEQREEASTADTLDSKEEKTTAFRNAVDGSKIQDQRGEKPVKQNDTVDG
ncbi:hypothetical protein PHYBOEH_007384 [Phytophthora boehmeriae]|uniref:Uncharacterized protein n=1 Tax=Phytophthora boehmeriae TaxID=109152 RepID=A0A8T1WDF0_9STRA|nr:hypothetical protein PHYBOEH_007384 [Phytophthora boehmeriae]